MAVKTFVLDTCVLLHSAESLTSFQDNEVVIPVVVLDEIDKFKKGSTEVNRNARKVIKAIDEYRVLGSLIEGVPLPNGGILRVTASLGNTPVSKLLPDGFETTNDNKILAHALVQQKINKKKNTETILVSKDINMRVKADALGLIAQDYETDKVDIEELYSGSCEIYVTSSEIAEFYKNGRLNTHIEDLKPNEYVTLINSDNPSSTALGRYDSAMREIVPLMEEENLWNIVPRNREQRFAIDLLLNDKIKLVTLLGKAGTGKTLLGLAVGLHKVLNGENRKGDTQEENFRKLNVYRPIVPMGKDIGYLPGREEDKIHPYMNPIYDNLEYLLHDEVIKDGGRYGGSSLTAKYLQDTEKLEVKALTYIRGRSLPYQIILVDEAQNLTPHEAKTIITRAGEGTKIILTGDIYQIDQPYIDSTSNGLAYIVEHFKNQSIAGHVTLTKGERSELAELAATILD